MAWRIDEQVIRGEIDSRVRGRVTGRVWLVGRATPVVLDLRGDPWRDLAGFLLCFSNPNPVEGVIAGLAEVQAGAVGDMTASRKVKVPECSKEELGQHLKARTPFPWRWGNAVYLEWFSSRNGRVVIESAAYDVTLEAGPEWTMSEEEEKQQQQENANAMTGFMERLTGGSLADDVHESDPAEFEDEPPQSAAEAEADSEAAKMDLLLDRIQAGMGRAGSDEADFERIMEEERARLRRERGEAEPPPPTPEEEEARAAWIEELNAGAEEALAEQESESWKNPERHPLVVECHELGIRLHHEVENAGWLKGVESEEHHLHEVVHGVMFAGAKLAGAFGSTLRNEWPPDPLFAGNILVRLKKARGHLRDAITGLDVADTQNLATAEWRNATLAETTSIRDKVHEHIAEVRAILNDSE